MAKKNSEIEAQISEIKHNAKAKKSSNRGKKNVQKNNTNKKNNKQNIKNQNSKKQNKNAQKREEINVKIAFLGGLNEVGKNMTLYECQNDMMLVDCGLAFPEPEMLGVDLVIPDFTYVEENASKIKGIVITHGHEDHIGGLAYLLQKVNIPVYGTRLTIGLIENKLSEHKILDKVKLNVIEPKDKINLGCFEVEAIHVNHSIPDAIALAINSPAGLILQTGDFKIDTTPIDGEVIDLARIARLGDKGVLCLLSDSTNAQRPGYTASEKTVGESFERLFQKADGKRLIVATFASNIHRVQQIIDVAKLVGRKVALSGRSLENVVETASKLGYLNVPDGILVSIDAISRYPDDKLVIITTGSQGEPMSALYRMAFSEHRRVEIGTGDYVIISATPIPGNEKTVGKVVDELLKRGAEVVYEKMYDVHVSGHACQEELKLILSLAKPKFFIPVHGEQKHIRKHAQLAESMGMQPGNIFMADNGRCVSLTKRKMTAVENVPAGKVFVDGYGVGDVGSAVIRERRRLAEDGLMIISVVIEKETGMLISGPEIVSRGFVYVKDSEQLIEEAKLVAQIVVDECVYDGRIEWSSIRNRMRDDISRFLYDRTKRSPMVLPIITSV
jgi:ribonuclease J